MNPIPEYYTQIPDSIIQERDELCTPVGAGESVSLAKAKAHTTYFCYHQLGYKPYAWQHMLFKEVRAEDTDILVNTIRQAGKTFSIEALSIQYCVYNLKPIPSKGYTIIGIASSSEDQQMKIIQDIRDMLAHGDSHLYDYSGGRLNKWFTSHLSTRQQDTNNKKQLTFREIKLNPKTRQYEPVGKVLGVIKTVPATKSARGNTFSLLFMDEAAFFDEDDFYDTVARPTLKATEGHAVVTTTPNGQRGWFYKVFDPEEELDYNPFKKFWLHYEHIEDEREYASVVNMKKEMYARGADKQFQQEYEALFTADDVSFFDSDRVDAAIDYTLAPKDSSTKTTDMGIDFGFKTCPSTICITEYGEDGIAKLVWHKVYPPEGDLNIYEDAKALVKQYNVQRVIIDECPAASNFIQSARKEGMNVHLMSFKRDKQTKYFQFRQRLYEGKIKFYNVKLLIQEMKALVAEEQKIGTRISKPKGGSDDLIDSFLMSCYFFIEEKKGLRFINWDDIE